MTRNTRTCLPPSLMPISTMDDLHPLDFSVLAHPIGSSSPESVSRDKALYISVNRPALLLGMKGPTGWQNGGTGKSLQELIAAMSVHAEASLDIINKGWQDHHRYNSSLCPPLPDEAIIFGVIYDSSQLHIIAHILKEDSPRHYVSYLVDSLEFPAVPDGHGPAEWFTGRLRVLVALLTLQRHVHRLGSVWGETAFSSGSNALHLSKRIDENEMDPKSLMIVLPAMLCPAPVL
ncbi:hypothetical protein CPB85DRAFT_280579 [Mucidula mucida]|nr:hypothetical protein CPB85DRAFT_280579 [Mucidula mucida]